jgi:hypothetical protein
VAIKVMAARICFSSGLSNGLIGADQLSRGARLSPHPAVTFFGSLQRESSTSSGPQSFPGWDPGRQVTEAWPALAGLQVVSGQALAGTLAHGFPLPARIRSIAAAASDKAARRASSAEVYRTSPVLERSR